MKLLLLLLAILASAVRAVEVNAEIKGAGIVNGEPCSEAKVQELFNKCFNKPAGILGFQNRNLRDTERRLKCNQKEWCTNPPPYSYCWLNCQNARRLVLDTFDNDRLVSVLNRAELQETALLCLKAEADQPANKCMGEFENMQIKIFY
jgi:hypothetical protein